MPLNQLFAQLADVHRIAPDFFARFEDTDMDTAPREELIDLMSSAPNDQVKYFILGKYCTRMALAAVTGRAG